MFHLCWPSGRSTRRCRGSADCSRSWWASKSARTGNSAPGLPNWTTARSHDWPGLMAEFMQFAHAGSLVADKLEALYDLGERERGDPTDIRPAAA
jgi:hypothetical protein